jgi:hypothetical protein
MGWPLLILALLAFTKAQFSSQFDQYLQSPYVRPICTSLSLYSPLLFPLSSFSCSRPPSSTPGDYYPPQPYTELEIKVDYGGVPIGSRCLSCMALSKHFTYLLHFAFPLPFAFCFPASLCLASHLHVGAVRRHQPSHNSHKLSARKLTPPPPTDQNEIRLDCINPFRDWAELGGCVALAKVRCLVECSPELTRARQFVGVYSILSLFAPKICVLFLYQNVYVHHTNVCFLLLYCMPVFSTFPPLGPPSDLDAFSVSQSHKSACRTGEVPSYLNALQCSDTKSCVDARKILTPSCLVTVFRFRLSTLALELFFTTLTL